MKRKRGKTAAGTGSIAASRSETSVAQVLAGPPPGNLHFAIGGCVRVVAKLWVPRRGREDCETVARCFSSKLLNVARSNGSETRRHGRVIKWLTPLFPVLDFASIRLL